MTRFALILSLSLLAAPVGAQDAAKPAADDAAKPAAADAGKPAVVDAAKPAKERLADPEGKVTTEDVIETGKAGVGKVREAIDAPTLLSIMGAISAGLWALLAAVRRFGGVAISGKVTRWITLIVTPVATFTGSMALGLGWVESLTIAGGGPGALLLNELLRTFGTGDSSGDAEGSAGGS